MNTPPPRIPPTIPATLLIAVAIVLPACTTGPDYERPDLKDQTPGAWLDRDPNREADQRIATDITRWWANLNDPELSTLIEQALTQSLDLAKARERIITARARRGIANADRLPTLDAQASYERIEIGDDGFILGAPTSVGADIYSLGAVAGWELDLWGRVDRLVEAADADIQFAVEDFRAARIALAAEVAREVILIRTTDRQLAIVEGTIEADTDSLSIARARADAGFGDELDAARASRVLEANRALIPTLRADRREAELRLATLLAARPGEVAVESRPLPDRSIVPALGVPADLLLRRPDLRRAERELGAATARIGAAEAGRFPRVALSGSIALQGPDIGDTLNPDAYILSAGPTITLPIFQGGRITAGIEQAESQQRQALFRLQATTLAAFAEVETAAIRRTRAEERVANLGNAEAAANDAEALALALYEAGQVDFLEVTEARRERLAIERDRTLAEREAILRLIDLYTALGGGWQPDQDQSQADATPR
ncbi:MAG: efflux transporter outer membrane subunit [Planctomycetota bacterium]